MAEDLVLDTAIRDWVLITLSVLVVLVLIGILRYFVSKLMRSSQLPHAKIVREGKLDAMQENGLLYVPKGQAQNALAKMFFDPNLSMDMMKKNLSMIIPQSLSAEKDSLHIVQHNWSLSEFELRAEAVRRKLVSSSLIFQHVTSNSAAIFFSLGMFSPASDEDDSNQHQNW